MEICTQLTAYSGHGDKPVEILYHFIVFPPPATVLMTTVKPLAVAYLPHDITDAKKSYEFKSRLKK